MHLTLTSNQIRETLLRQRWYAHHFYYGDEAREKLAAHILTHKGRAFSISVRDDGLFAVSVQDSALVVSYEAEVTTALPTNGHTIDNIAFSASIVNKEDLSADDLAWAEEVTPFVLSCFQRTIAFTFLARAADVTIDRVAEDLHSLQPEITTP